jgi:lysophospholipid acyltransferase (LPLAT)-like uncharacterized protein
MPVSIKQKLSKNSFVAVCLAYLLFFYLKFSYFFQKKIFKNRSLKFAYEFSNKPCIYVFWHGRMSFIPFLSLSPKNTSIIVSRHNDGRLIAKMMELFGFNIISGSSNDKKDRGGVKALIEAIDAIKAGQKLVITPDGPKGPAFKLKKSVLYIAQKTATPIIPISFSCSRKKVFKSWDSFIFPLPFGKASFVIGSKFIVPKDLELEGLEAEAYLAQLEEEINRITIQADAIVG